VYKDHKITFYRGQYTIRGPDGKKWLGGSAELKHAKRRISVEIRKQNEEVQRRNQGLQI